MSQGSGNRFFDARPLRDACLHDVAQHTRGKVASRTVFHQTLLYETNVLRRATDMDALNQEFLRLLSSSGWSQARAAEELRLDAATVSRYRGGTITPSETVLRLFAEILGEKLVLPGATIPPSTKTGPRHLEAYEAKALDALRQLAPDHRRRFCELISQMSELGAAIKCHPDAPSPDPRSEALRLNALQMDADAQRLLAHRRGSPATAPAAAPVAPAPANRPRKIRAIR